MPKARLKGFLSIAALVALCIGGAFAQGRATDSGQAADSFEMQTNRGEKLYAAHCAACHGANLEGGAGLDLVGIGPAYRWIGQNAEDLYQRVVTMPRGAPQSLPQKDYIDLTAFIIARNDGKPAAPLT